MQATINFTLEYNQHTDTVRLQPQNYIVLFRHGGHWVCDPDMAVPLETKLAVFTAITSHHHLRWTHDGAQLARVLNNNLREQLKLLTTLENKENLLNS